MKYKIEIFDNHLILLYKDSRFLIDTGSPITIANLNEIEIFGSNYKTTQNYLGTNINGLSESIGTNIDALVGGDILKHHQFQIDFNNQSFSIGDSTSSENSNSINIDSFMGIPIIEIMINKESIRAFLDTGAKLSYINSNFVSNLTPIDEREDFYPTVGTFQTLIYEFLVIFNDQEMNVTFGVLPASLEMALSMGDTKAIIGNDIFSYFAITFNYSNKKFQTTARIQVKQEAVQ